MTTTPDIHPEEGAGRARGEVPTAVIEGCRRGDRDAQRDLYVLTSPRIYALLRRMVGSEGDAFDLTQETYLKALRAFDRFDARSSVTTWLYRIAVNEALAAGRTRLRHERKKRKAADLRPEEAADEPIALRLDVQHALQMVSPTDRAMLLLRYHEGLDYRSIGEVIGCAEGTVASRLNRARQRLRQILGEGYARAEEAGMLAHPRDDGIAP